MVEAYTIAVAIYAAVVVVIAGVLFARKAGRPPGLDRLTWILEGALVVRATIAVGSIAGGNRPDHLSTHIGYLVSSVAILPIALASVADERDHWTSAVLGVAVLAVLVVVIRLQMTATGHA